MKNKLIPVLITIMVILLSACGPTPAPTLSAVDIQGTAVAAAWTIVAMTQAANPTATPIPPTETPIPTPLPTFTPLPLPTSTLPTQSIIGATPVGGGPTPNPCNMPFDPNAGGKKIRVVFLNESGGNGSLTFGMVEKTPFGECGVYTFPFKKNETVHATVLEGCYYAFAWVSNIGKNNDTSTSSGLYNFCLTDPSHKWTITIRQDVIGWFD